MLKINPTKDQMISHVSSIIDRHQDELEHLISLKPRPKKQIELAKERLSELRTFRSDISTGRPPDTRILALIINGMDYSGW